MLQQRARLSQAEPPGVHDQKAGRMGKLQFYALADEAQVCGCSLQRLSPTAILVPALLIRLASFASHSILVGYMLSLHCTACVLLPANPNLA